MRLINAHTLELQEFFNEEDRPKYAILSHTWGRGEVILTEMPDARLRRRKHGFKKIQYTCEQAIKDGYGYAWVDT